MAIFERKFVTMCLSLLCLPFLLMIFVLATPVVVFVIFTLYIIACLIYLRLAQTDAGFNLPYNPSRILKVNYAAATVFTTAVSLVPQVITHLVWRYWKTGPSGATEGVQRNVPYCKDGHKDHTFDLFFPVQTDAGSAARVPIIVFFYGGDWYSGNKNLYGLLANMLRRMGYIVVVPDYRKYPEVHIDSMYEDVRRVLEAVAEQGESWGGNVEQIFLMGHSAGAQLASQVVLSGVVEEARARAVSEVGAAVAGTSNGKVNGALHNGYGRKSKMPRVEGLILFSGVYDIATHYEYETLRGVEKISAMGRCMGGTCESFNANSPLQLLPQYNDEASTEESELLANATSRCLGELLPRIVLVHGERDIDVPSSCTTAFYKALGAAIHEDDRDAVDVRVRLYKRMGHFEVVTALMPNLFFLNRSTGSIIRDVKEFVEPDAVDEDY